MTVFPAIGLHDALMSLGPKLLAALFCGGLIGLERELKSKAAGIKTNMLICVGAMLYTALSIMIAETATAAGGVGDPGRIAAQIVSGIGFLGGGAIIQGKGSVSGLTTAATIWLVAALGVWIGVGQIEVALVVSVLVVAVLVSVTIFEDRFLGRKRDFKIAIQLRANSNEEFRRVVEDLCVANEIEIIDWKDTQEANHPEVRVTLHARSQDYATLKVELWKIVGVIQIEQVGSH